MKIGTIGRGVIVRSILDRVALIEGISCEAVYSRNYETGRKLADDYGVEKVYTDLEAMYADSEIDFIYVASPNSLHYDQVKQALQRGKNVLCEKPMVPYAHQARELIDLAKKRGLFLFEAITTLYHPHFEWIRQHLPQLGTLQMISGSFCQYSSRFDQLLEGRQTNVFDPEFAGGTLMDINVYNVFFMVGLLGRPDRVEYFAGKHENGIDTHGTLIMQYGNVICQCVGAKDTLCDNGVQIMGDKGYMRVTPSPSNPCSVQLIRRGSAITDSNAPEQDEIGLPEDQWFYEIQTLVKLVEEKNYALCYENLEKSLIVAEVLEAARKSAGMPF